MVELSDDLKLIENREDYQLQEPKVGDGVLVAGRAHGFQELAGFAPSPTSAVSPDWSSAPSSTPTAE